ncbi:MAG: spermidine/putrescine ABC transporter substrate-binding protein [Cyanobacteria bacterium CRU_2_1]|nr:spermidine/putrescine ABC transporter substrate-binding protein [Cyanobacteria bacterium RU_5_0]NJR60495.1 spermidine/putrescine ABC transporter substrate-binding protein [Cyanobacteria bacterium CRU_2_1]
MTPKKLFYPTQSLSYPTRRRFLQFSTAALSAVALANCQRRQSESPTAEAQPNAQATNSEPLYIYTWADYANEEVNQRFTEKTRIEVVTDVYDSNETLLAKMQAGGGRAYSILYPSDYMVKQMIDLDLLTELDHSQIAGLNNLLAQWQSPPYDPNNTHSVPISWGTTGFIYNTQVLSPGPMDWNDLWEDTDRFAGKITLLDDVREVMGATLKSLGYSYNSTNPAELEEAYQKLLELKPAIASFQSFGWEDQLISGDLVLSMTYSILGNALVLDNPDLDYVIPNSGTSVWTDTMVIPTTAPNPDAAYAWINFMLEPENSAFAVEKLQFATPNQAVVDRLPKELTGNTDLFPTSEILAKCEGIAPVENAIEIYDQYWTRLKST